MSIYLSCNGVFAWGFLRFSQQSLDFFVKFDENDLCNITYFSPKSLLEIFSKNLKKKSSFLV